MDNQDLTLERRLQARDKLIAELLEELGTCVLQIEYLHDKFQETGSGNATMASAKHVIRKAKGE